MRFFNNDKNLKRKKISESTFHGSGRSQNNNREKMLMLVHNLNVIRTYPKQLTQLTNAAAMAIKVKSGEIRCILFDC